VKRSASLKTRLLAPTSAAFVVMVVAMVGSAYLLYSSNVIKSSDDQMEATSDQVLNNYETYFDSVLTVSNNVISTYNAQSKGDPNLEKDMQSYFDTVKSLKNEILEMSLYRSDNGNWIAGDSKAKDTAQNAGEASWFSEANSNPLINIFSRVNSPSQNDVAYSFTLSRHITYDKDSTEDAILKINFDFAKIVDVITPTTLGAEGRFTIYDKDYGVVYTSNSKYQDEAISFIKSLVIGSKNITFQGHNFYLHAATISNTTWRVAIFINRDAVTQTVTSFAFYIFLIGAAMIILFLVIIVLVTNSVTRPIKQLQNEMAEIESLNYGASLHSFTKGPREVEELNDSFNSMMGRIHELTNSVVAEKEEQRKSELKALQNQINPHFLYNTLDSIIALIDKGENAKAEDMIVALSKFFRISISKGQNVIPLANEIEHARNYLLIQKMRFGDSFSYDIETEPGLEQYYVVKLILQPIIENSIGHGIKEDEQGHISIRAYSDGDLIKFEIKDNGYGMTQEKVDELVASFKDDTVYKGVGLKNVYQRIRIYYGTRADVLIHSDEDVGTTVTIVIPKEGALTHEQED
jgi:two-component system sensor histidine kinase YesM